MKLQTSNLLVWHYANFIYHKVISEKNIKSMDRSLLNKTTKFGTKNFRHYQVMAFLVLGHFLATAHSVDYYGSNNLNNFNNELVLI